MRASYYHGDRTFRTGSAPMPAPGPAEALLRVRHVDVGQSDAFGGHPIEVWRVRTGRAFDRAERADVGVAHVVGGIMRVSPNGGKPEVLVGAKDGEPRGNLRVKCAFITGNGRWHGSRLHDEHIVDRDPRDRPSSLLVAPRTRSTSSPSSI